MIYYDLSYLDLIFIFFLQGVIFKVVFKDNGQQLLSVSDDRSIRLWDLNSSSCLRVLYGHKARVWSAMFFNDRLVSIGEDATCILWDVGGSIIKKYKGHRGMYFTEAALILQSNP